MIEKTQLNPKLLEYINKIFDNLYDQKKAIHFCIATFLDSIDVLYEWGVMKDEEEEHKFRIALMERDVDTEGLQAKYKLKYPLFVNDVEEDVWDDFYKWLVKNPKLASHKGRFSSTLEAKKAFEELQLIKDFNLDRFREAVTQYYLREGQYAKALPKFLVENAKGEYEGFREVKSKLI